MIVVPPGPELHPGEGSAVPSDGLQFRWLTVSSGSGDNAESAAPIREVQLGFQIRRDGKASGGGQPMRPGKPSGKLSPGPGEELAGGLQRCRPILRAEDIGGQLIAKGIGVAVGGVTAQVAIVRRQEGLQRLLSHLLGQEARLGLARWRALSRLTGNNCP